MRQLWHRFVRFGVVGISGVVVNTALLYLLHEAARLPLLMASPLAVEASILNNFFWNNQWTFGRHAIALSRVAKFNLASLGGLAITTVVLLALAQGFGIYYLLANLIAIGLAMMWNFLLSVFWTWG